MRYTIRAEARYGLVVYIAEVRDKSNDDQLVESTFFLCEEIAITWLARQARKYRELLSY